MGISNDRCIDLAVAEVHRMADACRGADPAAPVPSCPEWDLAELQRHTGGIHRWAAAMVVERSERRMKREEMDLGFPGDPAALPDWLDAGADLLEQAFRGADPDDPMWAWGVPRTVGFWPRRMVHETTIHRADALLAAGRDPAAEIDAEVAADGIDELFGNLPSAARFSPPAAELRGDGEVLRFVGGDDAWTLRLHPDGFDWSRGAADGATADGTLATPSAAALLLTVYRRRRAEPDELTGDTAVVERWLANCVL